MSGTADGRIALMTGANLGGGSTINWTNCLRTYPWVREEWEAEHGLEGLAGPDFDRILDAVSERINVTDRCSDWNPVTETLKGACEARGHGFQRITRNADEAAYDADLAGLHGLRRRQRREELHAEDLAAGRRRRGRALRRELPRRARARGGRPRRGRRGHVRRRGRAHARASPSRAPTVVVAAGALDTPAVLLRSGIGGPAAGDYLRLHPATAIAGVYDTPQKSWWGPPQSGLSTAMADLRGRLRLPHRDLARLTGRERRRVPLARRRGAQGDHGREPHRPPRSCC